jgi:hypothetical protein
LVHEAEASRAGRRGTAITLAVWLVVIALSPAILLAGEFVNRYVMRRLRWSPRLAEVAVERTCDRSMRVATPVRLTPVSSLMLIPMRNPLWIALIAPGRWVADQYTARA